MFVGLLEHLLVADSLQYCCMCSYAVHTGLQALQTQITGKDRQKENSRYYGQELSKLHWPYYAAKLYLKMPVVSKLLGNQALAMVR